MNYLKLIVSIVICHLAGIFGSMFTSAGWYVSPSFAPPNWLFAPVWLILYTLMGIALFLVWKDKIALGLFGTQLVLNALWSYLFFGLRSPLYGFIGIVALWIFIVLTMIRFYSVDKRAFYLFVPYLIWVSFAMVLNWYIFILN